MALFKHFTSLKAVSRKAQLLIRRFRKSRSGVAATEFALSVPIMMSLYIGLVVASDSLSTDAKVTQLARTLVDMPTQMQAVKQSDMDSIFLATEATLWPHKAERLGMRVTAFDIDGAGQVFVDWSVVPTNGALVGSYSPMVRCAKFAALPAELKIPRTSILLAEVSMVYRASIAADVADEMFKGSSTNGEMPLGDKLYMRPRQGNKVAFDPSPGAACPGFVN